jgi:rhodanese-related sulfurtransferase
MPTHLIKRPQVLIVTKSRRKYLLQKITFENNLYLTMKEVSVEQLKKKIDAGEDFQLIDVREDFEYEMSNLGGTLIPLGGILIESEKISRDKPVVVMCRSGKRSAAAIMQLEQQGFTNLYNLTGGILAWAGEIDPTLNVY